MGNTLQIPRPPLPRVLFLDLDGTLLATGSRLRRRNAQAVAALSARGTTIVLATGGFATRTHVIAHALRDAGVDAPWASTHNGGAIWGPDGTIRQTIPIPRASLQAVMQASGRNVWSVFETINPAGTTQTHYAGQLRHEIAPLVWGPSAADATDPTCLPLTPITPTWHSRDARRVAMGEGDGEALGCWVIGTKRALAPLDAQVVGHSLYGAFYEPWTSRVGSMTGNRRLQIEGRDLNPPATTKATAVHWICAHLGIAPEETAAFGDGRNDRDMIATVGVGIAMARSHPSVREVATHHAPDHDDDGVAQVIERWLAGDGW